MKTHELTAAAALLQQSNRFLQSDSKQWKSPKTHGAARLFNYMEASDGSEPESDSRGGDEICARMNLNHTRIQSDFLEAGDAGGAAQDEEDGEETELPLFVCQTCGCEFEDDHSLETHQFTHRHSTASPANTEENSKENIDPDASYFCKLCDKGFGTQIGVIEHMKEHSALDGSYEDYQKYGQSKKSRKQSKPKRVVVPFWDRDEIEVLRHLNGKLRKWHRDVNYFNVKLFDKHMAQLVTRKGLACRWCKNSGLSSYHSKGSLALHHYWRHNNRKKFQCEHCNMHFTHRYQIILHASEVHVRKTREKTTVPAKEPNLSSVPALEDHHTFLTNTLTTSSVPDASSSNVHKLGMSFFDHSLLQNNPSAINSHMPLIIPTFPPN